MPIALVRTVLIAFGLAGSLSAGQTPPESLPTPRTLKASDFKGLTWRSVGPANMGGRVAAIALKPGDAKTFYVGLATGGLWKTTNAGTTFSPIFDKEITSSIGSIAVCDAPGDWPGWKNEPKDLNEAIPDPKDARAADAAAKKEAEKGKGKIIWVGTGEGNGRNSSSFGNGVYRSTDAGANFVQTGLIESHDIPAIAADPRNPDVCYAAALGRLWGPNPERGVYKTTDGGKTWTPSLQIDENTGACEIVIDPRNPDTLYAGMYARRRTAYSFTSGGPQGGVYKSTDAGKSWNKLTNGLPARTGRIGLDVFAPNPSILYAVVESEQDGWGVEPFDDRSKHGGVFKSVDAGETWVRMSDQTPRAFYFSKIRVDPKDDGIVFLLGWTLEVSDDSGRNWRNAARKPHGDMHALAIDPSDGSHLLMGTDGGVYQSWDRGATWDFHNQIPAGQFYNVALDDSDPYRIMGGLQDNGSWIGTSRTNLVMPPDGPGSTGNGLTNEQWRLVWWGDGFHCAFDPIDPAIVYAESQGGELGRVHLESGRQKVIKPGPREGQVRFRFNWNTPFFTSRHEPGVLYMGGQFVFRLTERGDKWQQISPDLTNGHSEKTDRVGSHAENHGTIVALAESAIRSGVLWAGSDDGLVHVTTDSGKTWVNVTPTASQGYWVSKIEPSAHDERAAYVSLDGHRANDFAPHVLATSDLGQTWKDISGNLPRGSEGSFVKVIREDARNPDVLYAGTERGSYISIDRGASWVRLNGESLPTVPVDDLRQHPRELDLVAATHGRSIFILDDASCLSHLNQSVLDAAVFLFKPRPARPVYYLPYEGFWSNRPFTAPNPPPGAIVTYWLTDYTTDPIEITIEDDRGNPIRKLTGPNQPGLNRVAWDLQREEFDRRHVSDLGSGEPQFVPPGIYNVNLTSGKSKASTTITVENGPSWPLSPK
ncbi:MAG: hypothetical protein JNM07_09910 [Phycisphaerae bacterium]|nr:hypothetical protein [Phycisphaerae bacterium]